MSERRLHLRFDLRRIVTVRVGRARRLEAWTLDVSSGGLKLQLPITPLVGQTVFIELPMTDSFIAQEPARICHVQRNYSGAEVGLAWIGTGSRMFAAPG